MHLSKSAYSNNSFIGLFVKASDSVALAPNQAHPKFISVLSQTLSVPVKTLSLNQSNLIGLSCVMNSSGLVVQSPVDKDEKKLLESIGLPVCMVEGISPSMNILANDFGCWISPRVSTHTAQKISKALNVKVNTQPFSIPALASCTVVTNKGFLTTSELTETEIKQMEKIFNVKGGNGTCNLGVPFNSLGVVANSKGALVGYDTSGFEIQRISQALDL